MTMVVSRPTLVIPRRGVTFFDMFADKPEHILTKTAELLQTGNLSLVDGPAGAICEYRCEGLRIEELRTYGAACPSRILLHIDACEAIEISNAFGIEGDPNDVDMRRPAAYAADEISESLVALIGSMRFHVEDGKPLHGIYNDPIRPCDISDTIAPHLATLIRARHRQDNRIPIDEISIVHLSCSMSSTSYGAVYERNGFESDPVADDGIFDTIPAIAAVIRTKERWNLDIAMLEAVGSESPIDAMLAVDFITRLRAELDKPSS